MFDSKYAAWGMKTHPQWVSTSTLPCYEWIP